MNTRFILADYCRSLIMDDSDDSSSQPLQESSDRPAEGEFDASKTEVIEDLTGEDDFVSDRSSLATLNSSNGSPSIKPRAYQIEMLEESLKHNIIVAVCL
jgi:hypothetical protein